MPTTKTLNFLPAVFQSETNKKFLNATMDQLVTEPNLVPVSGYVGRKLAPGFNGISTYIKEPTQLRADYQLEPSLVVRDQITQEIEFSTTYPELLQKIQYYGGKTVDQNNLWASDFYSYNPRINADAFINFGQYYWLPNGPDAVQVFAGPADLTRTFYVYPDNGTNVYNISGYGTNPNPDIVLARGGTYSFKINQPGKPFWIQTDPGLSGKSPQTNLSTRDILGVTNNGTENGTVTFNVPQKTAQDFFIQMPTVQPVDLLTTIAYNELEGITLTDLTQNYGGIDGQTYGLNGKYVVFGTYRGDDASWTSGTTVVPTSQRYGIWKIVLSPSGLDYIINLVYYAPIPINNKVIILSGIEYGNTEWYTDAESNLQQIAVVTAPLDVLYYQDGTNAGQVGVIRLVEQDNNKINVDTDIIGKVAYTSPNGVNFSNGLKIQFDSGVTPASYANNEYYVEGVGSGIKLIPTSVLLVTGPRSVTSYDPGQVYTEYASATLNLARDQISISTTDFPDGANVSVGTFPNAANSSYVVEQDLKFSYPYRAGQDVPGEHDNILYSQDTVGVTLPGIPINGVSNGAYVPGESSTIWHYDVNQVLINGQDNYGGQPIEGGRYVYTNGNFIGANAWGNVSGFTSNVGGYFNTDGHSKLIGFAADGYPIYGPFGYSNPVSSASAITKMVSSYAANNDGLYRPAAQTVTVTVDVENSPYITVGTTAGINPGMRIMQNSAGLPGGQYWIINNGLKTAVGVTEFNGTATQIQLNANVTLPSGTTLTFEFLPGAFIEDYQYFENIGTLDQYNGRYCVTPDFPNGTYAYFVTETTFGTPAYPYVVGPSYYGSLAIDTNTSLSNPDYIIINRASRDLNQWTRQNRWFHKDVIEATSRYNGTPQIFDADLRAKRPIIEFDADLQLMNFGKSAKTPVDIFDTTLIRPFLSVEGVSGTYVDGIQLIEGMRVVFAADEDPVTRNKIWVVNFVDVEGVSPNDTKIIHLTLAEDGVTLPYETVSVYNGIENNGKSFWYDGTQWIQAQLKTKLNQPPLFDVFDIDDVSFSDISKYPIINSESRFVGTKIFSYKEGTGAEDSVLGFPLSYKNFNNVGDIQFVNNFDVETFGFGQSGTSEIKKINTGFLHRNNADGSVSRVNVWTNADAETRQLQDISYVYDGVTNSFKIDAIPNLATTEPNLFVYVNAKKISVYDYQIYDVPGPAQLIVIDPTKIVDGDRIDILVYSNISSKLGFYEVPTNLNLNAQNRTLGYPTLGELRNHIGSLAESQLQFSGSYPGVSNLRDLYVENKPGTMLQQSAPVSFASLFLNNDQFGFVNSLLNAQQEYTRFKNKFLNIASTSNSVIQSNPVATVDIIIKQINAVKDKTFPWYYSGTVPYGDNKNVITYSIFDPSQKNYEITTLFNNNVVTNKAILIYLNSNQLIYGRDYTFLTTGPGVVISSTVDLNVDDILTIVEYNDTDGNWIPETPSKLGLYPKFTPEIYVDRTYATPQTMIRGHDGSLTPAFGDFRDALLLELEKRIYNNIKVEYSDKLVNIYDSIPGKFRDTGYSLSEFNSLISRIYLQWIGYNKLDYVTNTSFVNGDTFSYNYSRCIDNLNGEYLPGSWRACYEYYYDCQTPHLSPWEMLGFSEQPSWWESVYGPAPYTSGNKILWEDLQNGVIAGGDRAGIDTQFKRPGLLNFIPVNENGQLLPPFGLLTSKTDPNTFNRNWNIGQWSPTETAWRNSSEYPFALQYAMALIKPGKYFAYGVQTDKYRYDADIDQYNIVGTNNRITQDDVEVNGYINDAGNITRATGYLNWISDYQVSQGVTDKGILLHYVRDYSVQLSYRMAGFTGKQYLKILAEQNSPNSTNETIIIPDSDYDIILNKSTPVQNARYSALIFEKTASGFKLTGYDGARPYVTIIPVATTGNNDVITVQNQTVNYYTEYTNFKINIPYGTELTTTQQVANLLSGYERYLNSQGFRFDYFDETLGQIRNWQLSTREFLFWVSQSWPVGSVIVLGPFANNVKLSNINATVDGIKNSFYGSKVVNQNYTVLDYDAYDVVRDNNQFRLQLVSDADLIGFVELNLVQYEHALIFNNRTQFNDVIYDPILGQRQYRLKLVGSKTGGWNGTLSAEGFMYNQPGVDPWRMNKDYLKGDLVEYKNFYYASSKNLPGTSDFNFNDWLPVDKSKIKSGLLNNFARNAQIGETFYNVDKVNLESDFDQFALGLIGYKNRSYLNDLGLDDVSQVKFYQGFIKEKGTQNAINALGYVTFNNRPSDVTVSEDWAFRVGNYGSLETNQFVEFVLDESYTLSNPTSLEVQANNNIIYSSLYNDPAGVYKTSITPWAPPFLINRTQDSDYSDDIKLAGYVNIEDINYTVYDLSNIQTLNTDISSIGTGSLIWAANDYSKNWNVFRVEESQCRAIKIANALNGKILVTTDINHGLLEGDTIMMPSAERFTGFYKVVSIDSLTTYVVEFTGNLLGFSSEAQNSPVHKLVSMRVERPIDIPTITPTSGWRPNDKVWVNTGSTGEWAVYNKTEPWALTRTLPKAILDDNSQFGYAVHLSIDNKFALGGIPGYNGNVGAVTNYVVNFQNELIEDITVTSTANGTVRMGEVLDSGTVNVVAGAPQSDNGRGYVFVYTRGAFGAISASQMLVPNISGDVKFGSSLAITQDDEWLYVGAPGVDKVYVYGFNNTVPSANTTISTNGTPSSFSLSFTPVSADSIYVRAAGTPYVPYVDYTLSGSTITFNDAPPAGSIVITQSPCYQLYTTISGNAGTKFGHSVAATLDGSQLVIGSPEANVTIGSNTYVRTGQVDIWNRSIDNYLATDTQTLFGGTGTIDAYTKVYVDGILQERGVDWTAFAVNWVQFFTPPGISKIVTVESNIFHPIQTSYPATLYQGQQFGYSVELCTYSCSLFVGAPYQSAVNLYNGAVYRYLNQSRIYGTITGTVQNPTVTSGNTIRINNFIVKFNDTSLGAVVDAINAANVPGVTALAVNGYLQINSNSTVSADKLRILPGYGTALNDLGLTVFSEVETINNSSTKSYDYFGKKVKINANSDLLIVASDQAATLEQTTFDEGAGNVTATTFDAISTVFQEAVQDSGAVWIYSYLPDNRNSIQYPGVFTYIQQVTPTVTGSGLSAADGFGSDISVTDYEVIIGAKNNKALGYNSGRIYQFNDNDLLQGWDVYRFQEPRVDINGIIKSYLYSAASQIITNTLDFIDPAKGKILGLAEQEITYKIDYDPAIYNNGANPTVTKNQNLYWTDQQVGQVWWDLSTVRYMLYEQGTVKYRSTNWGRVFPGSTIDVYEWVESIYPPSQYVANGGSGDPKYPDNSAYVTLTYVDPLTNFATVKYYFWVKNKTTVDVNQFGRTIPTTTVAEYIRNPKSSGIKYFAPVRDDSVAVYNVVGDTTGRDTILHIDYVTLLNSNIIHSEYALLSDLNNTSASIPQNIYNKLVDSAAGVDKFGNPVPDPTLPVQTRYGIDIRPRQSMFVDKNGAIREMVTYVNSVFEKNIISQGYDLTGLSEGEPYPAANSGAWDLMVANLEELNFINILIRPVGFRVLVENDSSVDNLWTIYIKDKPASVWQANTFYKKNDVIIYNDRNFYALTDFTSGSTFDLENLGVYVVENNWVLERVESYSTSDYWEYTDWYAEGFNKSTNTTYTVNTSADLSSLTLRAQDTVKIKNNGQGKWFIIQVFPNVVNTVAIQDGTIKLKDNLYDLIAYGMGFDNDNFDTNRFDQNPGIEIRKIIETLRNDIFINTLDTDFLKLFFVFVHYVLDEQKSVDWVFKTSFINVLQKIKGLTQPAIYTKENQDFYLQYINEVKPYKTTIREYVVDYQNNDNYNGYVTDFDVPSYYDPVLKVYRSPSGEFIEDAKALQLPQYRDWLLNYPYTIASIEVLDGGTGYTVPPVVTVTGSTIGNDAIARALITNGVVSKIVLVYPGTNYISTPVVTIVGGNGTGATARANLQNTLIRNIKTTLVYNRYTYGTTVIEWTPNTLLTQGSIVAYSGVAYFVNQSFTTGSSFNTTNLTVYPVDKLVTANDRITAYYQPEIGQPGKNFGLLEQGITYPGVSVEGPLYSDSSGFDVAPFDATGFDPLEIGPDGTYVISDAVLDSVITSDFTDTSLGIRPEDIIVDGGPYVYDTFREWTPGTYYDRGDLVSYNNRVYYTIAPFTSTTTFDPINLTIYNLGPYASHAPEELIPGRVYDTLDITVSTLAVDPQSASYENWSTTSGVAVTRIEIAQGGFGYNAATVGVTIAGGTPFTAAQAQVLLDANGSAYAFQVYNLGAGYITTPNVVVTGPNTQPMIAYAGMGLTNAPLSTEPYAKLEYRIFKDMNDNYSFLRLDGNAKTALSSTLSLTDTQIFVQDSTLLPTPAPAGAAPGVIFINGERIEYYYKDNENNLLGQLRRATDGTGANVHYIGDTVIDGSQAQTVLYSDVYSYTPTSNVNVVCTDGNVRTLTAGTTYIRSNLWYSVAGGYLTTETGDLLTTETGEILETEDAAATDGQGLFMANTIQVAFLKQGLMN